MEEFHKGNGGGSLKGEKADVDINYLDAKQSSLVSEAQGRSWWQFTDGCTITE